MTIYIPDDNPKMKRETIKCDICNKNKLCIRSIAENVCEPCSEQKMGKEDCIFCVYCEVCGHLIIEDNMSMKVCSECDKTTGVCCGRLYHCQSTECLCKKCFDYKCMYVDDDENECVTIIPKDRVYVSDGSTEYLPWCEACIDKFLQLHPGHH